MARFEPIRPSGASATAAAEFAPAFLVSPPVPSGGYTPGSAASARDHLAEEVAARQAAAELRAAREESYAAGLLEGAERAARSEAARVGAALEAIAGTLGAAAEAAAAEACEAAEAAAEALARLLLAALDAALPPVAAAHEAESRITALLDALRPALAEEPRLVLRVATEIQPALSARLAADPRVEVVAEPALALGDARLEWRGGSAEAVLETRWRAVRDTLAALGLEG